MLFVLAVAGVVMGYSAMLALFLVRLEKPSPRATSTIQALAFERAYQAHHLLDRRVDSEEDSREAA